MTELITPTEIENSPLILHLHPVIQLTNDQFFEFCQLNRDLRFERTARGELLIMPPTGTGTGGRSFRLIGQLFVWTEQNKTGIGFDSSTGFIYRMVQLFPLMPPGLSWNDETPSQLNSKKNSPL